MLFHARKFLLVVKLLHTFVKTADICHKPNWNNYTNGKKLSEFPIKIFDKIGLQSCYKECQAHGNCFSANYDRKEFTCQLMNDKKTHWSSLIDDDNSVYMEMPDPVSIAEIDISLRNSKQKVHEAQENSRTHVHVSYSSN